MKHIVIGDIHGRDAWKNIHTKAFDKVIFIGDYVDSPDLSDFTVLENLKAIIALKKSQPDKIVLLLGNHDIHYLHHPHFQCSGFRNAMQPELTNLYRKNADLFQIAYQKSNYLFTHAGVTNSWYDELMRTPVLKKICDKEETMAAQLNALERTSHRGFLYQAGFERGGFGFGGPVWADMKETFSDTLNNFNQIVGHTKVEEIRTISYTNRSITYTDVLTSKEQCYQIDIP